MNSIADRLKAVRDALAEACVKAGRAPDAARLVAVSKTQPLESVREAAEAGQRAFGENRPQEMTAKHAELPDLEWHLIGQLQTNKVKYVAPFVQLIHSLDSVKLLEEIEKQGAKSDRVIPCLIQVNISDEDQKSGADEAGALHILERLPLCPHVRVEGLMGIAEHSDDMALVGRQFARLRRFGDSLKSGESSQFQMKHLSMGMTHDYAVAVAEGATLVRIGSAIFGERG